MSFDELEEKLMRLDPKARAQLAAKLLHSLGAVLNEDKGSSMQELQGQYFTTQESKEQVAVNEQRPARVGLGPSEKLQLVEALWDDIASAPNGIPVQEWQMEELERRKANLVQHPQSGLSWEEVRERVLHRSGG